MPTKEEGHAIFEGIKEVPPSTHGFYRRQGVQFSKYWSLRAYENTDSEETIVETTHELLSDAIERQLVSDVPLCTFLSGGLDSSVITAVAAQRYKREGRVLSTYSFEFEGNSEHFTESLFQPQRDDAYARYLADFLGTRHTVLSLGNQTLANLLGDAVRYRDYPGMADIDASLLAYCRQIKPRHTVALSGECADEIFGGYPWFYHPEMLHVLN